MNHLQRREFLKIAGLGAAATATGCLSSAFAAGESIAGSPASASANSASGKPNVIFILADDMGYGEVGCFGQKKIKTPNLDKMAAEGMRLTQSYCGSSVCAPSRCALMTGLHLGHTAIRANRQLKPEGQEPLPAGTFTVAHLFKSAGYKTGAFGKWGLGFVDSTGAPDKMGFDTFFGYNCQTQAHEYYPDHLWRNRERVELDGKTYSHDLIAKESLQWLRANAKSPFFLYLPFTIPHAKYQVPDLGPYANEPWAENLKTYAAMITRMDADIGRLFALLKELGLDERTLVIFTSDNGAGAPAMIKAFESNGGLRGMKRSMYEGGIREPGITRWPGKIKPGAANDTPWAFYDFLPTVSEVIGASLPAGAKTDGISIAPALFGGATAKREFLYWELHEPRFMWAVRMGNWKGVCPAPGKPIELYDLSKDPTEANDLAAAQPDVIKRIAAIHEKEHVENPLWPDPKLEAGAAAAPAGKKRAAKAKDAKGNEAKAP
ncbi:MAG: arylsulfatase [Candidatus Sumerlaeota bacterium]|nr:arylsulfatase [Candidatus Sumerlaeota bacterium]